MTTDNIPAFLLKGAPTPTTPPPQIEPTHKQVAAALLAYDLALPDGAPRVAMAPHATAIRAALIAALNVRG